MPRNNMPKILIADDAQFMRNILVNILTEAGFTDLLEAGNGREALSLYEKEKPDIILLDIIMPEIDGMGVLEKLSKSDIEKVIVISAVGQEKMKDKAKALGVKYYIVKPFEEEEVIEMIERLISRGRKK